MIPKTRIMYVDNKSAGLSGGPARIGRVTRFTVSSSANYPVAQADG